MNSVICHVEFVQRGAVAAAARLTDPRTSASWVFSKAGSEDAPRESVVTLSRWIGQQLAAAGDAAELLLCLDVDQAACGWVTSSGTDDKAVKTAVRDAQSGEREDAGQTTPANWLKVGEVDADLSVQALEMAETSGGQSGSKSASKSKPAVSLRRRLAVVALPDLAARVLVNELDKVNRPVIRILTLWHAVAEAWDPGSASASSGGGVLKTASDARVVADEIGCSASVLIDPRGRLLWTWQQGGRLLCAGTIRLALKNLQSAGESASDGETSTGGPSGPSTAPVCELTASEVARLTADWLAWAPQIGTGPAAITVVGPHRLLATGLTERFTGAAPLSAFAAALGSSWPGSVVSAVEQDDPIEATLRRVIDSRSPSKSLAPAQAGPVDPRTSLIELASRPGKASRLVYRWSAAAITAGALVLIALCLRVSLASRQAAAARVEAAADREKLIKSLVSVAPKIVTEQRKTQYLRTLLTDREKQKAAIVPEKPIVPELARLFAAAAQLENVTLRSVQGATATGFRAQFNAPAANTGNTLVEKLEAIKPSTSEYATWAVSESKVGDVFTFSATGTWAGKLTPMAKPEATPAGDAPKSVAKPETKPAANPETASVAPVKIDGKTDPNTETKPEPKPNTATKARTGPNTAPTNRGQQGTPSTEKLGPVKEGDPARKPVPVKVQPTEVRPPLKGGGGSDSAGSGGGPGIQQTAPNSSPPPKAVPQSDKPGTSPGNQPAADPTEIPN